MASKNTSSIYYPMNRIQYPPYLSIIDYLFIYVYIYIYINMHVCVYIHIHITLIN
jgi:hypothetical protein